MARATDAELALQAAELAEKALPASLPAAARAAKLPAVKQKILERLRLQRASGSAPQPVAQLSAVGAPPPPPPGPPPPDRRLTQLKVEGAELCGDEFWFSDAAVRLRMRRAVAEAHAEQKILVGPPSEEIQRICPQGGTPLGAGAVLRLGGSHLGGYSEADIAYAYRQLSRALHPDKNHDLERAPEAFHRLSQAVDELKQGLAEQRQAVQLMAAAMGQQVADALIERPQEALFAEACRLLTAVCGLEGEGEVPTVARSRAMAMFTGSSAFSGCRAQVLLNDWFDRKHLLESLSSPALRIAYDCAPKRHRAQFLCLLNRAISAESLRNGSGCVREGWTAVAQAFPELAIWRDMRACLRERCWEAIPHRALEDYAVGRSSRSRSRNRPKRTKWARKWRAAMIAILPSGEDAAVPATDPEVRKLSHVLWKDIAAWASSDESGASPATARALGLFKADH
ncbi:unnamed protein product, partial [Polarella glacialis]